MKKILVVDDDPTLRELLQIRLESNGYEVITASDGVHGFAEAKRIHPDLIVLDVSMPAMDGYSLVKELKWHDDLKTIPILILTAKTHTEELFELEGISSFMTKPFNSKDLLSQIERTI